MQFAAMIVFGVALAFILLLFIVKRIEARRERRLAEPFRAAADRGALHIKGALEAAEGHLENTPFLLGALARWSVHIGALSFARLARASAEYAHRLADFVSHKHRFERRETKSHYLKMVGERPAAPPVPESVVYSAPPAPVPEYIPPQESVREEETSIQPPVPRPKRAPRRKSKKKDGEVAAE